MLEEYLWPKIDGVKYEVPAGCPLDIKGDMYAGVEADKVQLKRGMWKCGECNKSFRGEEYLDKHIANRSA